MSTDTFDHTFGPAASIRWSVDAGKEAFVPLPTIAKPKPFSTGLFKVMTSPWAILPEKFAEIQAVYERHIRGESLSEAQIEAAIGRTLRVKEEDPPLYENRDGVAVISVDGVISKKMNLFSKISGGTSTQLLSQAVSSALSDPNVRSILLQIDSPGGSVDGTQEIARQIFKSRGQKPITAYTDGMMASAAYWIGSAADRLFISGDTTQVGSIGVVTSHVDISQREAAMGVKTTEIVAGKYKRIASSYQPLSDEGRANIQDMVDHVYAAFLGDVAAFRGSTPQDVHDRMADGRLFIGMQAIKVGLVDGVSTLEGVLSQLQSNDFTYRGGILMNDDKKPVIATVAELRATYPQLVQAVETQATEDGKKAGREEGARAERERIKAVEEQSIPGHEALIQNLKFDGKTSGPEAAVQILAAEKKTREGRHAAMVADAPKPVEPVEQPKEDPKPPTAEAFVKQIQEREKCDYKTAARIAAVEKPDLFRNR